MNDDYQFTSDWFSGHEPIWDQLIEEKQPRKILEIGSYEGRSACHCIERCSAFGSLDICCIDTWQGGVEHDPATMNDVEQRFDHNIQIASQRAQNAVNVMKMKKGSNLALAELFAAIKTPYFDLIYIDGSHQAPDVLSDAVMSFPLLNVGGVMIFDDYTWHEEDESQKDLLKMPKIAIDAFLTIFARKMNIILLGGVYQLYTEKFAD